MHTHYRHHASITQYKAIVDIRLSPRPSATHGKSIWAHTVVLNPYCFPGDLCWVTMSLCLTCASIAWEITGDMKSSTKPKYITYCSIANRKTEPWPQATCTENMVMFGSTVAKLCTWTDKHTDRLTCSSQYSAYLLRTEIKNIYIYHSGKKVRCEA